MGDTSRLMAAACLVAAMSGLADGVPIEHVPREPEPPKGQRQFKRQSVRMFQNMATRKGAIEGLRWAEHRDTVAAQKGLSTRQLEGLRRTWAAMERDPQRLPWPEFIRANRA